MRHSIPLSSFSGFYAPVGLFPDLWFGSYICLIHLNGWPNNFIWFTLHHISHVLVQSEEDQIIRLDTHSKKEISMPKSNHKK